MNISIENQTLKETACPSVLTSKQSLHMSPADIFSIAPSCPKCSQVRDWLSNCTRRWNVSIYMVLEISGSLPVTPKVEWLAEYCRMNCFKQARGIHFPWKLHHDLLNRPPYWFNMKRGTSFIIMLAFYGLHFGRGGLVFPGLVNFIFICLKSLQD